MGVTRVVSPERHEEDPSVLSNRTPRRRILVAPALLATVLVVTTATSPVRAQEARTHEVQPGETLSGVAAALGTSTSALVAANGIDDPNLIHPGQLIETPRGASGATGGASPVPEGRRDLEASFDRWARANGFRPSLLKALCYLESGWQADVVSHAGAEGVCQILPDTEDFLEAKIGRELDSSDPHDNIRLGARYIRWLLDQTDWDVEATVGAYYQGLAAMREHGPYAETERYVANVLALEARF